MKKIVFVHSPIQAYLVKALIAMGEVASNDVLVFHRGFRPLVGLAQKVFSIKGYALNNLQFLAKVMSDSEPVEIVLPHSLCVAFHLAELLPNVQKISFLEEGTGTPCALKDHAFSAHTKCRKKNIFQKTVRTLSLVASIGAQKMDVVRALVLAEDNYNSREGQTFINFDCEKFGVVYGLAYWQESDAFFKPAHIAINQPKSAARKVVIAIGKQESEKPEYWRLLAEIISKTLSMQVTFFSKLHPSINCDVLLKKCPESEKVLSQLKEFDPHGNELGFALIEEGFLGAVSFFSSYQVYAHIAAREAGVRFPMLCLESLFAGQDYHQKLSKLPDIGLLENAFFSIEEWLAALQDKLETTRVNAT